MPPIQTPDADDSERELLERPQSTLFSAQAVSVPDAIEQGLRQQRALSLEVRIARRHGDDVAAFISHTIRDWDARTLADTLEAHVGRDLQFIRINGTVIGGLIGLALHAGGDLLDHL